MLREIYWDEERTLSQMSEGGMGGETTSPLLLKLSSVCPNLVLCVKSERGIQWSKLVCVGVYEDGQKACKIGIVEMWRL